MEILGSTFDDSVFEVSRNKEISTTVLPSYKPKCCEPEWFSHHETFEDRLDEQKTFKFRADLKYRRQQYQDALKDYTACLLLVPNNNLSLKRDVLEGMTRCYSHLQMQQQALETCETLRKEATNTCHLTCVLQLELSVYEHCADSAGSVPILQQLCSLHPFNPWHWLKLATLYLNLLQERPPGHPEHLQGQQEDKNVTRVKAAMCFIRTRLLIEILRIQQFSFVLERSRTALQVVEESLLKLQLNEKSLQTVTKVMAEDLNPEKMREENQDGEGLSGLSIKDFEERWWNKVQADLQMENTDVCSGTAETPLRNSGLSSEI